MSPAWAATPVLSDLPPEIAVGMTGERTGIPLADLVGLDLSERMTPGLPDAIPCSGPPVTQDELRTQLEEVVDLYDSGYAGVARNQAAGLATAVACLTEQVDPVWLWSAGFVTGVLAWADGDREAARRAWAGARAVDPRRPWDDNFAPGSALDEFATAVAADLVHFDGVGGPFLVDGRSAPSVLASGLHVVQVVDPLETWLVEMHTSVVAVHPAADLESLSAQELSIVLASRLPEENVVYVVRRDTVLELDLRHGSSRLVLAPDPPPERRPWGGWVAASGAAVVAGGLLTNLILLRPAAVRASEEGWAASDLQTWTEARDAHAAATDGMLVGYGAAGLGFTLVIVGTSDLLRGDRSRPKDAAQGP
jgi:hypothetical protein